MKNRTSFTRLLIACLALAAVLATAASAQKIEQFDVGAGCGPWGIAGGPDGNLWLTCGSSNQIKKISPAGSVLATITLVHANSYPVGITTGPDGNLWFGEHDGNRMARITPAGIVTEFDLPNAGSGVVGVAPGSDGNVWFTEQQGHRVGKITPSGSITEYTDPENPGMRPGFLALGPDGNLWVNEGLSNVIAKVTPGGVFTDYTAPSGTVIGGITNGADGYLWFVEDGANRVARIRASDGHIDEFGPFPDESGFGQITLGADGRIWVDENAHSKLLRLHSSGVLQATFTVASHAWNGIAGPDGNVWWINGAADAVTRADIATGFEDFPFPCTSASGFGGEAVVALPDGSFWGMGSSGSDGPWVEYHAMPALVATQRVDVDSGLDQNGVATCMTADASGNLWFPDAGDNAVVEATLPPSSTLQFHSIPTPNSGVDCVAFGADGNLWFTELDTATVARMTADGTITEFATPDTSNPAGIAPGPDGNLWFTNYGSQATIGRITTAGAVTAYPSLCSARMISIAADATVLWYSMDSCGAIIGRIDTSGNATSIPLGGYPYNLTVDAHGTIWFDDFSEILKEFRPSTGALLEHPLAWSLFHQISASPVTGIWYATSSTGVLCDGTHPGIFGHLRPELFVDGFESGNVWRWSTRSF